MLRPSKEPRIPSQHGPTCLLTATNNLSILQTAFLVALSIVSTAAMDTKWQLADSHFPLPPLNPCWSTTNLPPITVTRRQHDDLFVQVYTVTYDVFCKHGLCPQEYIRTQTCDEPVCQYHSEKALPPGFTQAAVVCQKCGGSPRTEILTVPTESVEELRREGYQVDEVDVHRADEEDIRDAAAPGGRLSDDHHHKEHEARPTAGLGEEIRPNQDTHQGGGEDRQRPEGHADAEEFIIAGSSTLHWEIGTMVLGLLVIGRGL